MTNLIATTSVRSPLTLSPIGLAAAFLLLVLLPAVLSAQTNQTTTDKMTPTGIAPGAPAGSYPLSGFETINLFNGNLDLRLPLVALSGRGSAVRDMMLSINTKKWRVRHEHTEVNDTFTPTTNNWGNVVVGYEAGRLQGRQSGWHTRTCSNPHQTRYHYTITRLTFVTPDGTEYDFRDEATDGEPKIADRCAQSTVGAPRGTIFKTTDGSGVTFISDSPIFDKTSLPIGDAGSWVLSVSGEMLLRDGTRYRIIGGHVDWIRDRNGNLVYSEKDAINRSVSVTAPGDYSRQVTYKGFGGAERNITVNLAPLGSVLRSGYSLQTYFQLFPQLNGTFNLGTHNPILTSSVVLPDGRSYQFRYNSYGELARVELPTGGAIEYDMTPTSGVVSGSGPDGEEYQIYRRVIERRTYNGSTLEGRTTYTESGSVRTVDNLSPSGTLLSRELHYFFGDAVNSFFPADKTFYSDWHEGKEYATSFLAADGVTVLKTVTNTWEQRAPVAWYPSVWDNGGNEPSQDPRLTQTVTTLPETNQVSKITYSYDQYNNQTDVYEYDYGTGGAGALIRHTHTDYLTTHPVNSTDYTANGIYLRSLPTQQSVFEFNGSTDIERARTTYEYDNYATDTNHAGLTDRANISGHDGSFTTGYGPRGNVTGTTHYLLTNGSETGSVSMFAQYDIAGNVVKTIDQRGNATLIDYCDHFGAPDGDVHSNTAPSELANVSEKSYAFPTRLTNALGQSVYGKFDYYLGRAVDGADLNGIVASGYYDDILDRPSQVRRAVDTEFESQTTFIYDDPNRTVTTTSDLASNNDSALVSKTLYDSLGRTTETRQYEGGDNYIAKQTQYDALGRAYKTSNPFRSGDTVVWTTSAFDGMGRLTSVTTPDSAVVSTAYNGSQVLITDQAGKQRLTQSNGLGQLKHIWEITAPDAATEPISFPGHAEVTAGYHTTYSYDVLDDLTDVTQGAQSRTFTYDSLKRLTSAFHPESGTVNNTYDANGNLLTRTDARSITTTIVYDALNRPTSKSYNDTPQTPTINYFYDSQTLPANAPTFDRGFATGRLVAVTYGGGSAGNYTSYDVLGRAQIRVQQTDSVNYASAAVYNVRAMTSESYPKYVPGASDHREVNFTYDPAGRPYAVTTPATSYGFGAGISGIGYSAHGAVSSETYDNSLVHAITYNNRLQADRVKLGTSGNPTSILDLTYGYGTTTNNGNVLSVGYNGGGLTYTQTFSYDALNRLGSATETAGGGTSWSQTNGYDRYGNRWVDLGGGNQSLYFTAATNRISGSSYDAVGNLLNDGVHAYTYDAEDRIRTVDGVTAYVYDGEGQRIRKLVGEDTRFVYDIAGQLIMEFDGTTGGVTKEYLHGGGSMATIVQAAKVSVAVRYVTSDNLGTPRVITKPDGSVAARHDYKPFGEEISSGTGGRTTTQGYGAFDGVRQKFTSKERDNETGLDFFEARYYASTQGRFTSADSLGGSQLNPQTFNLYAYVKNNPLKFVDPSGHAAETTDRYLYLSMAAIRAYYDSYFRQQDKMSLVAGGLVKDAQGYEAPEEQQEDSSSEAETGIQNPSLDREYNCMAHILGFWDRWIEPGEGGKGITISYYRADEHYTIAKQLSVTPGSLPGQFTTAKPASRGEKAPKGYFEARVYEDRGNPHNWHAERRDTNGTWSSKDGADRLRTGIRNPDRDYVRNFKPTGQPKITYWFIPSRSDLR